MIKPAGRWRLFRFFFSSPPKEALSQRRRLVYNLFIGSRLFGGWAMWKRTSIQMLFIGLATALSGELRVTPFNWDFRFGLGSSTFLLLLLLIRQVPVIRTGIIAGLTVAVFRTMISPAFFMDPAQFPDVFMVHLPAMFYYITFAFGMNMIRSGRLKSNLLLLACVVVLIDISSNIVEIFFRTFFTGIIPITPKGWLMLFGVSVVRVFFVIGIYANVRLTQLNTLHREQEKRLAQMLDFGSSLYSESFYLKKMMDTIERITADAYELYRRLKDGKPGEYSKHALRIAEKIHEVKKDAQRVIAGLAKSYDTVEVYEMSLKEIIHFVIRSNRQYSEWLGKQVEFRTEQKTDFHTTRFLPLLTVLNNVVANSIEAIHDKGRITIVINEEKEYTHFLISDTGEGIMEKDIPFVFKAGFTTKFNEKGIASTGIGLSHVQNIVELFEGSIHVESGHDGTNMHIRLPTHKLIKEN
jgi:two-component system sensor histidine kinase YcbA